MYSASKDRTTEYFKFVEDENGEWVRNKDGSIKTISCGKKKNESYIPGGEKKRPKWCKRKFGKGVKKDMTPQNDCIFDECPYLALTGVDEDEYMAMIDAWAKVVREQDNEEGKGGRALRARTK